MYFSMSSRLLTAFVGFVFLLNLIIGCGCMSPPVGGEVQVGGMVDILWKDVSLFSGGCMVGPARVMQWSQRVEAIMWQWDTGVVVKTVGDVDLLQRISGMIWREAESCSVQSTYVDQVVSKRVRLLSERLFVLLDNV